MKIRFNPFLGTIAAIAMIQAANATSYTWTQNSVATQTWTTADNWDANGVFATGSGNTLTFFSDITTALANGTNSITGSVPTALTMNILTLNGKGAAATAATTITIASSSSTWTLDGTTPTVNLNGVNGSQKLNYTVAAKIALTQANTLFTGNGTAGFTFSGIISGASKAITKSGSSNLILTGANTYSGGTTLSDGTITIGTSNTALGGGTLAVTGNATLATAQNLGARTLANQVSVSATKTLTLNAGYANLAFTNTITNSGTITTGGGGNNISSGYIVLSGTNADSGKFIIGDGSGPTHGHTIQFAKTASLYNGNTGSWTASNILVKNGGALSLNVGGTNEFTTTNVTTLLTNLGGTNGTSSTGFASGSAIGFDTTNASGGIFTVADNIANSTGSGGGSIGLFKYGNNTLELTGASNTYSGTTSVSGGTLKVSGTGAINPTTGATLSVQGNSTLQYDSSATSKFGAMNIGTGGTNNSGTLNQTNGVINGTSMTLGGGNSGGYGGTVAIGNASGNAAALNISGDVTVGVSGVFNSNLTVNTTGTLNVTGSLKMATTTTRDATGTITQSGGAVSASSLNLSANVNDATARTHTSVYNLNGGTLSIGSITTGMVTTSGTISNTFNFAGGTLTATGDNASFWVDSTYTTANVKDGGAKIDTNGKDITIGQSLLHFAGATTDTLTKSGSGTLTLTGTNTYTGETQVNAGSLMIGSGGSLAGTVVTIGGAMATGTPTLGGVGTIGGSTTIAAAGGGVAGIHAPGIAGVSGGVGTQVFSSNLTYGNGSIFEWDINANSTTTGFDKVTVGGNVSVGSDTQFKVNLGSSVFTEGDFVDDVFWKTPYGTKTWNMTDIFSKAFSSGAFASVTAVQDVSSYGSFTISGTTLTWTAVPEPTSALAGLLISAGLLRRRRA